MATVGERIKEARKLRNMSRPALAEKTGIPYPTLAGLENGDQASSTELPVIAHVLEVHAYWLQTGKGPMLIPVASNDGEWAPVLAFRTFAALGEGYEPDEYAEVNKLHFRAESLQKHGLKAAHLGIVYGKGDSMQPTIRNGDAILVDRADTALKDGRLYVVRYDGALLAKRLVKIGGMWCLASDSQTDRRWRSPEPVDEVKHFAVFGRVRWVGGWRE